MTEKINSFEDNLMPRSTIRNCAKAVLKADAPIQKEALLALTKASTVFISYLTAQANEIAISRKRKTIMPVDVFEALKVIEFERFVDDLKKEHEEQDALRKEKRNQKRPTEEDAATQASQAEEGTQSKRPRLEEAADPDDVRGEEDSQSDTDEEAEGKEDENENDEVDDADDADETLFQGEDTSTRADDLAGEAIAESQDGPTRDALDYDEALDNGDESD
ncbi:histone-fold-containing protein [Protomyces lactucae-debilis]|uniref:DNA polymerase epsilon subunit D n=1 Tax=Protomyces lactucae-debilis TaxID=2754530 RepID=A0A1Y2FT29_PROLT|nr:histone-fold-containing protein [Protomyces lactucae-debilis]ORY87153.1 histone-fold-containing protein [Protomyces lactucae-debilis]